MPRTAGDDLARMIAGGMTATVVGIGPPVRVEAEPKEEPMPKKRGRGVPKTKHELVEAVAGWDDRVNGPAFVIPLKIDSGDNSRGRYAKIGAAGSHRKKTAAVLASGMRHLYHFAEHAQAGESVTVRITRLGGRGLDGDGLQSAAKYVRDTVAMFLGVDDGPRGPVRWEYDQRPGGPYGVMVEVTCQDLRRRAG